MVHGAAVACTCGSSDAHVVFPDRGYDTGYFRIGLDTDTSAVHNFSNMFGICKCTTEACTPLLVERWVETARRQNVNGGHPLVGYPVYFGEYMEKQQLLFPITEDKRSKTDA